MELQDPRWLPIGFTIGVPALDVALERCGVETGGSSSRLAS
jgi:hypothetical protein